MQMPILPIEAMMAGLCESEDRIVRAAFTTRGVKMAGHGKLLTNKPNKRVTTFEEGCTNYVWRMLCFDLAGFGKHACMPVCADFDLADAQRICEGRAVRYGEDGYEDYKKRGKDIRIALDALVKKVESVLPLEAKRGIVAWGRALGML